MRTSIFVRGFGAWRIDQHRAAELALVHLEGERVERELPIVELDVQGDVPHRKRPGFDGIGVESHIRIHRPHTLHLQAARSGTAACSPAPARLDPSSRAWASPPLWQRSPPPWAHFPEAPPGRPAQPLDLRCPEIDGRLREMSTSSSPPRSLLPTLPSSS